MGETSNNTQLHELVNDTMTPDQFVSIIDQLLTKDSKEILGDNASESVAGTILKTSVIGPAPDTFSERLFRSFVGVDKDKNPLPDEQVDELTRLCLNLGIFEPAPTGKSPGKRFIINNLEFHETLRAILHRVT